MTKQANRYNQGKPRWSLVDFNSFLPTVKVLEYGALKYTIWENKDGKRMSGLDTIELKGEEKLNLKLIRSGENQWKDGFPISSIVDSLLRHALALASGEWLDPESGLPHVGHIGCNIMFIQYMMYNHNEKYNDMFPNEKTFQVRTLSPEEADKALKEFRELTQK